MAKKSSNPKSDDDRKYHVMRFTEADKEIMKTHFHMPQFRSWNDALDALIPIVEAIAKETGKVKKPKREKAMRLGLHKDFIKAAQKLKKPMTETIIVAAKRYAANSEIGAEP